MRGKKTKSRQILPDPKYKNEMVAKFINFTMYGGKKSVAKKIVYDSMDEAAKKLGKEPLEVLEKALQTIAPTVEVRSRRVGGATYQVPMPVSDRRQKTLACRWIISAARSKKGADMVVRLSSELVDAYNATGAAFKKKEDVIRMAEANRAFSHFATTSTSY